MLNITFIKEYLRKSFLLMVIINLFTSSFTLAQSVTLNYFNSNISYWENVELQKAKKIKIKKRELRSGYYTSDEKLPKKKALSEVTYFDKNGNMYLQHDINSFGTIRTKTELRYDDIGNMVDVKLTNSDGLQIYRKEVIYNGKDTSEVFITDRKKNRTRQTFSYDDKKLLISKKYYDEKDSLYLIQNFQYENGFLQKIDFVNEKNEVVRTKKFKYDSDGNLSSELTDGAEKKYFLDNQFHIVRTEEGTEVKNYKYNADGNLIDYQFFIAPNRRQFRLGFTYLKNGLLNEIIRYDSDEKKAFYLVYNYKK